MARKENSGKTKSVYDCWHPRWIREQ